jgi:hypothetical protein
MPDKLEEVFFEELRLIESKRKKTNPEDCYKNPFNLFGIALSGGGIRSATLNLGILEVFNKCSILKLADYLSIVSGGEDI